MLNFSTSALTDADVLLYVTDVVETPDKHNEFIEKVARMEIPVPLLINKIDLSNQEKPGSWWKHGKHCCLMRKLFRFLQLRNSMWNM